MFLLTSLSAFIVVNCVVAFPVSHPLYPNQYVSAQAIPAVQYRPQAQGYQPQQVQYVQPQQHSRPVYERPQGLTQYSTQSQPQQQHIQQILLANNVDRQVQKVAQTGGPLYLSQVQAAQQAAQAQQAFAAAQRKTTSQTFGGNIQPVPVAYQPPVTQVRYVQRPQPQPQQQHQPQLQYRPQSQAQRQEDGEEYDHNPSYQFGFDVKDDLYTNYQNRKEQREQNKITGSYSVVDPDGYVRTVKYTADPKEGFKAEVTRQPTDIVVKIPRPDPQFQKQPQQYIQAIPRAQIQQEKGGENVYQYQ